MRRFRASIFIFAVVLVSLFLVETGPLIIIFFALGFAVFIFFMAMCLRCNFFVKSRHRASGKNIILSFDDGPHENLTPKVLDILKKHQATAAFFLIGKNIAGNENTVKRMASEGHLIGSHSFSHVPQMGRWMRKELVNDYAKAHENILKIAPEAGRYFRPPFGLTNPRIASALKLLKLQSIGWSLRTFDTAKQDENSIKNRILKKIKPGDIVLMHDTQPHTVEMLDALLTELKKRNFTIKATL